MYPVASNLIRDHLAAFVTDNEGVHNMRCDSIWVHGGIDMGIWLYPYNYTRIHTVRASNIPTEPNRRL